MSPPLTIVRIEEPPRHVPPTSHSCPQDRLARLAALGLGLLSTATAPAAHAALPDPLAEFSFTANAFTLDSGNNRPRTQSSPSGELTMAPDCAAGITETTTFGINPTPCNITSGFGQDADGEYLSWTAPKGTGGGFEVIMNSVIGQTYTIAMKFAVPDDSGYRKLVDFQGRTNDNGFYLFNGQITFYPSGDGTDPFTPGTVLDLILVRDGATQTFKTYIRVAGTQLEEIVNYADPTGESIPETVTVNQTTGSKFGFFVDDTRVPNEGAVGARIYNVGVGHRS